MTREEKIEFIKSVAASLNYYSDGSGATLYIWLEYAHGVAFKIAPSGDHLQVYPYYGKANSSENEYATNSIYSLRSEADVADFCTILSVSARIRAARSIL